MTMPYMVETHCPGVRICNFSTKYVITVPFHPVRNVVVVVRAKPRPTAGPARHCLPNDVCPCPASKARALLVSPLSPMFEFSHLASDELAFV